ncbi:hypothetical protein [Selenomonas artemidis]|uniref:hypothetical protein n=1 Tax=Selenomonas artemidis TaxID=671224 RepID=UPI00288C1F1B|nr:hypothetical protein [Selenomonas artemidis]
MAHFPAIQLTKTGKQMIGESQGNAKLIFVRAELGDGQLSEGEDTESFTGLKHSVMSAPLQNFLDKGNGEVRLRFSVSNRDVTNGFMNREIGIFAKLDDGEAKLYAYTNAGNFADYIPSKEVPIDSEIIDVHIIVAGAKNVTAVISDEAYVTRKTFEEHNIDPNAHPNLGLYLRRNSTAYAVGDIAYHKSLPSWARLECVKAGTTASTEPAEMRQVSAGKLITDGGVTWIVDDVREGARVGDIVLRPTLRDGFIKANGATVKASEYPRLLAWAQEAGMAVTAGQYAQDCSKYVYDAAQDKLTLPNMTGRVLQGGETVKSVEAGLPQHTHKLNGWVGTSAQKEISSGGFSVVDVATSDTSAGANNPIYGRSDTVQPPALHLIAQIKY